MIPPYAPPRSRSGIGWIIAFIGMGLFIAVVIAVMMIARFGRSFRDNQTQRSGPQEIAKVGESELTEGNSDRVENTPGNSTLTKTFALDRARDSR